MTDRIVFVQSDRWCKRIDGGTGVYDVTLCAYCARPVRPDAVQLRTARTNDGEWWLVGANVDLTADEWRDFQRQPDGSSGPTLLPIGPDCLRVHPEFDFAVFLTADDLAGPDVIGSPNSKKYTRAVAGRRGQGKIA